MGRRTHAGVAPVLALGLALLTAGFTARADDLAVSSLELGPWAATVSALQHDVSSQGRSIHVQALDAHRHPAACGTYALHLDAAGQRAFQVGACDRATSLTEFRLVDRSALFAHDDVVPRPIAVALGAQTIATQTVCRALVRPSLEDLEHGTRLYLSAPRFSLRVLLAGLQASPSGDGWMIRGGTHAAPVEYDVVDTTRNRIVLHEHTQLECVAQPVAPESPTNTSANASPVASGGDTCGATQLVAGTMVTASTTGHGDSAHASCGGGAYSPDMVYALNVPARSRVEVQLHSAFDGVLYLRRACGDQTTELACNDDDPDSSHSRIETTLDAGTYYVVVDGYGSLNSQQPRAGTFELLATVEPLDGAAAATPAAPEGPGNHFAGTLASGVAVQGATLGEGDHFRGSCGSGTSPDVTWRLVVRERARVSVRLESDFDGVLTVRRTPSGDEDDVHCNDDAEDTRHSEVTVTLDPGMYYVVVDGYSSDHAGHYSLTATVQPSH